MKTKYIFTNVKIQKLKLNDKIVVYRAREIKLAILSNLATSYMHTRNSE